MEHLNIRSQLALSYTALFALVLLSIGALTYHVVIARLDYSLNHRLDEFAAGLWGHMKLRDGYPTLTEDPNDYFVRVAAQYYQLYDGENGRLLEKSEDSVLLSTLTPDEVTRRLTSPRFDRAGVPAARLRSRDAVVYAGARHPYLLRIAIPLVELQAARQELIKTFFLSFPVLILLGGLMGWWMAGKVLKPVGELRQAAHEIGISHLNLRLPLRGTGDELDRLAKTFNEVFARLEEAVLKMKQFTASISHELRTPLAVLQGEAEMAIMDPSIPGEYRRVLGSQLEEFQKLSRLVGRLLVLARAEAGEIQLSKEKFDVSGLVRSLAEQMQPIAANAHVCLTVACPDPIEVVGDAQWIERAILNLLDNAIKFTPQGGSVHLATMLRDNSVSIDLSDTGIGISEEAIPHLFTRFYRADSSRSKQIEGVGLGLVIAKWIVEAHRGAIEVRSEPGVGSRFTVLLPRPIPGITSVHAQPAS